MAASNPNSTVIAANGGRFPPTLWSVVLAAGQESSESSREALATLFRSYWCPLYVFVRKQGKTPHDAEDLTQGFFVHLLDRGRLEQVRREKGRFRSFLLASLKNFMADEWSRTQAQKRGGGAQFVPFEFSAAEEQLQGGLTEGPAETLFDRRWAMMLLERTLSRLEAEYAASGRKERFDKLKDFLSAEANDETYAVTAVRIGMSAGALKVAVVRLRQRYRELLRSEVAQTVSREDEVDNEIHYLFSVLSR